jgi:hypothetical protein
LLIGGEKSLVDAQAKLLATGVIVVVLKGKVLEERHEQAPGALQKFFWFGEA